MSRKFQPKVATANDLFEGDVTYFSRPFWTRDLALATVATSEEAAQQMLADASGTEHNMVGVYLADVDISSGKPRPVHFREEFRTRGPSNYFHGKQEKDV